MVIWANSIRFGRPGCQPRRIALPTWTVSIVSIPSFIGLVLYTSGTTGAAQAIWKKLAQMAVEVATLEKQFGDELGTADILATVSHQHIYGLLFNILWPLAAGRAIRAQNFSFFEELTTLDRDCALVSSPAHLKRLPENPAWPMAAKRLRAIFSSGGPLPFEVAQESKRLLGRVPIEVYGSSETGGIAYRRQETKTNEAWTPFPGVDWRVDAEEQVLEVRSANLPDRGMVSHGRPRDSDRESVVSFCRAVSIGSRKSRASASH